MDFLEHEMPETALVGHVIRALQLGGRTLLSFTAGVVELNSKRSQQGNLSIFQRQNRARYPRQRGSVTSAKEFAFAEANQQGGLPSSHNKGSWAASPNHS